MTFKDAAKTLVIKYKALLEQTGLLVSEVNVIQYCYELNVSGNNEKLKVQVYFGKKGTKTVLQGNKEGSLYYKVNELIFGKTLFKNQAEKLIEPEVYIGTDESGKGDYFGPLIIAGVLVNPDITAKLKVIGVRDSKKILDKNIRVLSAKIQKIIDSNFDIIYISPKTYNVLYDKMRNVNRILGWAHARVLENILQKNSVEIQEAISDKFGDESLINNALQEKGKKLKLHQVTKAERYTAVAAASILARNKFNEWFEIQNIKMKTKIPKGASEIVNKAALKIRNEMGEGFLSNLVKLHFKNSKNILG